MKLLHVLILLVLQLFDKMTDYSSKYDPPMSIDDTMRVLYDAYKFYYRGELFRVEDFDIFYGRHMTAGFFFV